MTSFEDVHYVPVMKGVEQSANEEINKRRGLGVRHVQACILFVGLTLAYSLRVNLSVGIVAMTDNKINPDVQTVNFSPAEKGTILGSFFWGYLVTQIPAGQLAARIGASKPLGISMMVNGITTLLLPVAAIHGGFVATCFVRVLQGLGQGFIYPSVNTLMSKWAVPQERSRIYAFVFGGTQFGTIIMMIAGGLLAASSGGWPSIFYVSGGLSAAWGVLCLFYVADSPEKHKNISKEERIFIESSLISTADSKVRMKTPWMAMVCSGPLWALLIVHLAQNWGFWTLLTLMPTYISGVLHFDIKKNGLLSSLPYIAMWVASFIFAMIADWLIKNKKLSTAASRKFWNSIALYGGAVALTLLALLNTNTNGAISLLVVAVGLNAGTYSGYMLNHLDLSPNFAGTLMGITNGLANITSILAPSIAGVIVTSDDNVSQWRIVFLLAAGVSALGQTIFNIFGSADVQSWNSGGIKQESTIESIEKDPENKENAS